MKCAPFGNMASFEIPTKEKHVLSAGRYNNQPGLAKTSDFKDYCPEGCPQANTTWKAVHCMP